MLAWFVCLSIGVVVYSYAIYPLALILLASIRQAWSDLCFVWEKTERRGHESCEWPRVDIIISAFNERAHIAARIENLLSQDYPGGLLRVRIGSDGSTDGTADILSALHDPRLDIQIFAQNRGKASVLNDLVARSDAPLLIFSDANTVFDVNAIRRLVAPFGNPEVGAVSGELRLKSKRGDNQDGLYWRYEQLLKMFEARVGALLGANGAIYAIRRELWTPLRSDTICDDFCVAMNIASQRYRVLYEPRAWAEEEAPAAISDEYRRRVRIGIGNYQALFRNPQYLFRTSAFTAFAYVSHKIFRWLAPHFMLLGLAGSALLSLRSNTWLVITAAQIFCYVLAVVLYRRSARGRPVPKILRPMVFLFALNWAFLVASAQYARGTYQASWTSVPR